MSTGPRFTRASLGPMILDRMCEILLSLLLGKLISHRNTWTEQPPYTRGWGMSSTLALSNAMGCVPHGLLNSSLCQFAAAARSGDGSPVFDCVYWCNTEYVVLLGLCTILVEGSELARE